MKIGIQELKLRVAAAYAAMRSCRLCPRACGVNRLRGELGKCHIGKLAKVSSHNAHFGEEPPISGTKGSGTIFFTSCNLRCMFCQNYPISQLRHGRTVTPQALAKMMLWLEKQGCHNINLVTPSHVVPQFLAGLYLARRGNTDKSPHPPFTSARGGSASGGKGGKGGIIFNLPIVYNSSGYDGLEALKLLDGVIDIYMPDIKYSSNEMAEKYSQATGYWDHVRPAIKEMYRQVGDLQLSPPFSKGGEGGLGVATRGLLIRHLVLPGGIAGTQKALEFIADEISPKTYVSLMSQYFPAYKAVGHPLLDRRITREEWFTAEDVLHRLGLEYGWVQHY